MLELRGLIERLERRIEALEAAPERSLNEIVSAFREVSALAREEFKPKYFSVQPPEETKPEAKPEETAQG